MDVFGHVNNVAFLTYLEEARVDMLFHPDSPAAEPSEEESRESGVRASPLSDGCLVVRHEIDYKTPLVHRPQPVRVETWVTRLRAASFELAYEVRDEGALYATAASVLVPYDLHEERPRRLTPSEREFLAAYMAPPA